MIQRLFADISLKMNFDKTTNTFGSMALITELSNPIEDTGDFLDVLISGGSDTLVLGEEHLTPAFFDLKTGIAGDMLQKVSNYRKRLIIIRTYDGNDSPALQAFIKESNRSGIVVFSENLESALKLLR